MNIQQLALTGTALVTMAVASVVAFGPVPLCTAILVIVGGAVIGKTLDLLNP